MTSPSDNVAFLIFHRQQSGKPTRIYSYEEEEATYLLAAINICRELLTHPKSRQAFENIFETYEKRVQDMCAAAKKAKNSKDLNSKEHKQYRIFIFMFAVTFFHELGHVFITYLSKGDSETPPELTPEMSGIHEKMHPEAGHKLEEIVFGGSVQHGRHDDYDDSQPGVPHLVNKDETGQISQQTVDEFLRCNFKFPIPISDRPISDPLKPLGEGYDDRLPNDPLSWPQTQALAEGRSPNPYDFTELDDLEPSIIVREKVLVGVGAKSALARVVFQPTLAVK